jgi:hypothetical protein
MTVPLVLLSIEMDRRKSIDYLKYYIPETMVNFKFIMEVEYESCQRMSY